MSPSSTFGDRTEVYNGVEGSVQARFGAGGVISAGVSIGSTLTDSCASPDFPSQFCRSSLPVSSQSQDQDFGRIPPQWGLQVSGALQNLSGIPVSATYVATNAEVVPSLGRNLAACGSRVPCTATTTVTILEPNTEFEDRVHAARCSREQDDRNRGGCACCPDSTSTTC